LACICSYFSKTLMCLIRLFIWALCNTFLMVQGLNLSHLFWVYLFTYSYVHTLFGSSPPHSPLFPSPTHPPHFQAKPVLPSSLILLKRRYKE
jgi:hypothetical protein